MVAMKVGVDTLFKQHSKLLSSTFHMSHRTSLYLRKNLIFGLFYLVALGVLHLVAREVVMDVAFFKICNVG